MTSRCLAYTCAAALLVACRPGPSHRAPSHLADGDFCGLDSDCTGGATGAQEICQADGTCGAGCHADSDCSDGQSCQGASPDGQCGAAAWELAGCGTDSDCSGGASGTATICTAAGTCGGGCHVDEDCATGQSCQHAAPDGTCGSPEAGADFDAGSVADAGGEADAGSGDAGGQTTGNPLPPLSDLPFGATQGRFPVSATITIGGSGSSLVGAVQIANNVGTLTFQGNALPAVAYEVQPFSGYTLYQLLAVAQSRLVIAWVYCQGGQITGLYRETTDGTTVAYEAGSGSCGDDGIPTTAQVALPSADLSVPSLVPGVTLTGSDATYDGTDPGSLSLNGTTWSYLPFNTVVCATCGTPGWFELHSLLWEPVSATACFTIVYLVDGTPSQVHLGYTFCLPNLTSPNAFLNSTWTHP